MVQLDMSIKITGITITKLSFGLKITVNFHFSGSYEWHHHCSPIAASVGPGKVRLLLSLVSFVPSKFLTEQRWWWSSLGRVGCEVVAWGGWGVAELSCVRWFFGLGGEGSRTISVLGGGFRTFWKFCFWVTGFPSLVCWFLQVLVSTFWAGFKFTGFWFSIKVWFLGKVWFLSWFGFIRSRLGGVCGWNILASAAKLLLGFLCVIGRVSWFGFSGVGRFGL